MQTLGSTASVIAALADDAAAEAERRLAVARAEAERIEAGGPALPRDAELRALVEADPRVTAARRQARELLAREEWLDARSALEDREEWMLRAAEEGRRRLVAPEAPADRRARLRALAAEALAALPAGPLEVAVSPEDATLTEVPPGVRVVADATVAPGGCLARTADGKVSFDNGVDARARRCESAWRGALGRLYGK